MTALKNSGVKDSMISVMGDYSDAPLPCEIFQQAKEIARKAHYDKSSKRKRNKYHGRCNRF